MKRIHTSLGVLVALVLALGMTACAAGGDSKENDQDEGQTADLGKNEEQTPTTTQDTASAAPASSGARRISERSTGCSTCGPLPDPWTKSAGPLPDPWKSLAGSTGTDPHK